ncbi:hypothetical protein [uncultured Brevundimonas sp.]|uniref:hypothetical protein n=1 Tax=uncultured Brevundimonas sp. TaxID=213418 RepID=UPI00262BD8F6|nr:hypothetical protein [uncultured Brevundimonas sp.]
MTQNLEPQPLSDDWDDDHGVICPHCMGDGSVDCNCGGDLCVCENYGERDCPLCFGGGAVTEAREQQYLESRRQAAEAMKRVWGAGHD